MQTFVTECIFSALDFLNLVCHFKNFEGSIYDLAYRCNFIFVQTNNPQAN